MSKIFENKRALGKVWPRAGVRKRKIRDIKSEREGREKEQEKEEKRIKGKGRG